MRVSNEDHYQPCPGTSLDERRGESCTVQIIARRNPRNCLIELGSSLQLNALKIGVQRFQVTQRAQLARSNLFGQREIIRAQHADMLVEQWGQAGHIQFVLNLPGVSQRFQGHSM